MHLSRDFPDLFRAVAAPFEAPPISTLGLAVSGGSDSLAMLHLYAQWADQNNVTLRVATVDHGLRAAAVKEAAWVAGQCQELNISHDVLQWISPDNVRNVQSTARTARYGLLADWAVSAGLDAIAIGHTIDDQAETFLMRLARGSGVDGLSAMRRDWHDRGVRWVRPLLDVTRARLRDMLQAGGQTWIDDPSNDDTQFDRVKARQALQILAPLGITADRLSQTADQMTRAGAALHAATIALAKTAVVQTHGDLTLDVSGMRRAPREVQLRMMAAALGWISGAPYRPRLKALEEVYAAILRGETRTLQGVLLTGNGAILHLCREANAATAICAPGDIWDTRWQVEGPKVLGAEIRALGEVGILQCPDWRDAGLPRASLLASPAVWKGETLISAPLAGNSAGWSARIVTDFVDWMESH